MKLLAPSNLGVEDQRNLFQSVGYTNVEIFEESAKLVDLLSRKEGYNFLLELTERLQL
jgi:hypothetical protein